MRENYGLFEIYDVVDVNWMCYIMFSVYYSLYSSTLEIFISNWIATISIIKNNIPKETEYI